VNICISKGRLLGPNNSFKPTPHRGVGHVLYATLAHVRHPAAGRLNSGVRRLVNDRHEVLEDEKFWLALEFGLSGWFRTCGDKSLGGFWCDGFIPESVNNTRDGIEISGVAWVVDAQDSQHKCSFVAAIPQRMLSRRRDEVAIDELELDLNRKKLSFSVSPAAKSPNTSLERTRGG
jgi:hypothetical protein